MKINKEEIVIFIKQNIKTIALALITSIVLVVVGLNYLGKNNSVDNDEIKFSSTEKVEEDKNSEKDTNKVIKSVVVDIKGEVKKPGVYESTNDKRVKDIIEEAGGLTSEADTSNINLSEKLKDQMVIVVAKKGEKVTSSNLNNNQSATVNINTATKEQLMKVKGVGQTKAEAIIKYRENKGEFQSKEDIMKVKGIGKATYEKIKDDIEV